MQLASSIVPVSHSLYEIQYHSGEPFRWKYCPTHAAVAASSFDASPVLDINGTYIGFDGNNIIPFNQFELLTGIYSTIDIFGKTDFKINPKTEYVEKVPHVYLPYSTSSPPPICAGPIYRREGLTMEIKHDEAYCNHVWKEYTGFTEIYKFCEKCDKKEYSL